MANEVETYMPLQPFALLACVIQASAQLDKLEAAEVDVEASDDVTEVAWRRVQIIRTIRVKG